jgi:hypothetical protein
MGAHQAGGGCADIPVQSGTLKNRDREDGKPMIFVDPGGAVLYLSSNSLGKDRNR